MRLATYAMPPSAQAEQFHSAVAPGLFWAQFGDTILLYSDETRWEEVSENARRNSLAGREHPTSVQRNTCTLWCRTDDSSSRSIRMFPLSSTGDAFYWWNWMLTRRADLPRRVRPVMACCPSQRTRLFSMSALLPLARTARVNGIEHLVSKVARSSLEANLTHLAAFPTRYSTSTPLCQRRNLGAEPTESTALHHSMADHYGQWQPPVGMSLLTKKGNAAGRHEVVLITAHLDSINIQGGPAAPAPGADDNGSGSAGLLEIARAFADHRMRA